MHHVPPSSRYFSLQIVNNFSNIKYADAYLFIDEPRIWNRCWSNWEQCRGDAGGEPEHADHSTGQEMCPLSISEIVVCFPSFQELAGNSHVPISVILYPEIVSECCISNSLERIKGELNIVQQVRGNPAQSVTCSFELAVLSFAVCNRHVPTNLWWKRNAQTVRQNGSRGIIKSLTFHLTRAMDV